MSTHPIPRWLFQRTHHQPPAGERRWISADDVRRTGYGLDIEDIGPSLRWANATTTRTTTRRPAEGAGEPWPESAGGVYDGDEPRF
ncbi:hypothetical protein [Nonomuraea sp. NPDC001699]